jgi:hypothetical protein
MRRTINADGELVEVGSNDTTTTASSPLVSNSGMIDVFGFNLEWRQLLISIVLASLLLGIQGGKLPMCSHSLSIPSISHVRCWFISYLYTYFIGMALLIALGAYTAFTRATATAQGTSSSSSRSNGSNNASSSNQWTRPSTGEGGSNPRGGGRSNVRGISDLPCDPKRG